MKAQPDFEIGQKIDDYFLQQYLGGGQDGEVWRVMSKPLGRIFAIKFLNSIDAQEKTERFDREIRILKELHHPCIVSVFAKGEAWNPAKKKNVPYYVMEYMDGVPLDCFLEKVAAKDARHAFFKLFEHAAKALIEIHEKGMSHGDIKPANIFVLADGLLAKVTDFGFGIPPGEQPLQRDKYPESSYRAPGNLTPQQADIYRLGRTFGDGLRTVQSKLAAADVSAIDQVLRKLTDHPVEALLRNVVQEVKATEEFGVQPHITSASHGGLDIPELTAGTAVTMIRDPIQGDIALTKRCMAVLRLAHFRHLRLLRVYPFGEAVYPALSQTRFECVVGGYAQLVKYFQHLYRVSQRIEPVEVRSALLASLMRDIGQYPFSTVLPYATTNNYSPYLRSAQLLSETALSKEVFDQWEVSNQRVLELVADRSEERSVSESCLWGVLSASSMDDTLRSTQRAGMQLGFDPTRILRSLVLTPEDGLAVCANRADAVSEVGSYLGARYMLLERVTGHKIIRAADRMLAHAFSELFQSRFSFGELLDLDERGFLEACRKAAEKRELSAAAKLLGSAQEMQIYHPVVSWSDEGSLYAPLSVRDEVQLSRVLESELGRLSGSRLPTGGVVFHSGTAEVARLEVDILDASWRAVSTESLSLVVRNFGEMTRRFLRAQILFVSAEVAESLAAIDLQRLKMDVQAIVENNLVRRGRVV